jgi:hypothetical protein
MRYGVWGMRCEEDKRLYSREERDVGKMKD